MKNQSMLKGVLTGVLLLASLAVQAQSKVDQTDPQQMILGLSTVVLGELNERAEELAANPGAIRAFADEHILPFVDTNRMARYIVGRYWRTATEQQQQAFTEQFTLTMMRSYSQSLLKLKIDKIDVANALPDGNNRVIVPTRVTQADGSTADVGYRVFKEAATGNWLVYDVIVEGISLLVNFRESYTTDIERRGFDQVILSMQERNQGFE